MINPSNRYTAFSLPSHPGAMFIIIVCIDEGFEGSDNALVNFEQIFNTYSPSTIRKAL